MNWLRHELRLRAHEVGRAIQFMEEAERRREIMMRVCEHQFMTATPSNHPQMTHSVNSWSEARNHETKFQFMTHSVKSF
jgi:hypothetical protein